MQASAPRPTFTHLLDTIDQKALKGAGGEARDITLRDILAALGPRSWGALLLILGVVSISPLTVLPGANWLVAAITLLVALQMTIASPHLWLPRRLLNVRVRRSALEATLPRLRPLAQRVDAVLRPRLPVLARPPWRNAAGLMCAVAALATFPLGLVPFGPVAPGLAVTIIGLGLFFNDGLFVLVGTSLVAAAMAALLQLVS